MAAQLPYGKRIGYTSLKKSVKVACNLARTYGARTRTFIPEDRRTIYDNGLAAIIALCDMFDAIDTFKLDADDAS